MSLTDLPLSFWGYALETTAFTLNRAPSKSVEMTLYEMWFGNKPKLSFLIVWGCDAYVKRLHPDKHEPKSEKCFFIGYPKETIGYTFYHKSEGKIFVAKNKTFLEKEFLSKEVSGRKVELDEVIVPALNLESSSSEKSVPVLPTPTREETNDKDHETSDQVAIEPRRSSRARFASKWYGNPVLEVMLLDHDEPTNYEEAMMSPDSNRWLEAMKSEIGSIYENKVWTLVDCPMIGKPLRINGSSRRRLMLIVMSLPTKLDSSQKVFDKVQGVDYDETFSSVAMLKVYLNHVSNCHIL